MSELHCPNCGHLVGRLDLEGPDRRTPVSSDYMTAVVDQVSRFVAARTRAVKHGRITTSRLREEYLGWCADSRETVVNKKAFGSALRRLPYLTPYRSSGQRYYDGLALKAD